MCVCVFPGRTVETVNESLSVRFLKLFEYKTGSQRIIYINAVLCVHCSPRVREMIRMINNNTSLISKRPDNSVRVTKPSTFSSFSCDRSTEKQINSKLDPCQ